MDERRWLTWARRIHALAQTNVHYATNDFDRERNRGLLEIAAEMISQHSHLPEQMALQALSAQPGYVTPKVDVRGAVFQGSKILLVQESADESWTLPGGWAEVGEKPSTSVEREVQEETGLYVAARRLIGVYDANRVDGRLPLFHAYKLVFLCDCQGGELQPSLETRQVGWFDRQALPQPMSAFRTTPRLLEDAFASLNQPVGPAQFD
jgi:ADP-ribose pyrophosphatase YjhB (NUDIX family)